MPMWPPDTPPERPGQLPASSFSIIAPYAAGSPDPIFVGGDADAGGRDDVAGDVAAAMANAQARYSEHESDTYGQGSVLGDVITFSDGSPLDPGAAPGETAPSGSFYDPPRGGAPETFVNTGNEPA
jgi:hypothetical protein